MKTLAAFLLGWLAGATMLLAMLVGLDLVEDINQ